MKKFKDIWPKYVMIRDNHQDSIILVNNEDEYKALVLKVLEDWYRNGDFGEPDWFFNDTYDEYFFHKMGFNQHWYKANIERVTSELFYEIKRKAKSMPKLYREDQEGLRRLNVLREYFDNGTGNYDELHDILTSVPWGSHQYKFSPQIFDTF